MNHQANYAAAISLLFNLIFLKPTNSIDDFSSKASNRSGENQKIQAAILLDVSNSMDGLIDQAKNQLWNMVSVLGKIKCQNSYPPIEIAIYEYGRPENDPKEGYVRQVSGFTNDLDKLFRDLISLTTHGGDEFCGHVIYSSLKQLSWDTSASSYKVIFIAGNESFLQGDIEYKKACAEAREKGVIVNTIYCGDKNKGISEGWDLGAECGEGSFSNIDQNAKPLSIPTPYDSTIIALKEQLNQTYLVYGREGLEYYQSMLGADTVAATSLNDPTKVTAYVVTRARKNLFYNPEWDLIDAMDKDSSIIEIVDMKTLVDSLQDKTRKELKQIVGGKAAERRSIQNKIADLRLKQESFIASEKARATAIDPLTLETVIEKIIKEQVKRHKMFIE